MTLLTIKLGCFDRYLESYLSGCLFSSTIHCSYTGQSDG